MDVIKTPRLTLRPYQPADVPAAFAWFSDPEVMHFIGSGAHQTIDQTAAKVEEYQWRQARHGFSKWIAIETSTGIPIGDAGLTVIDGEVELGYKLHRSQWGRGLATEMARAWLTRAFGPIGLERVIAFVHQDNVVSIHVVQKLGFRFCRNDGKLGMPCNVYETFNPHHQP
jgi:RimJ/RimL family protein N-acetyltransferase